jgi:formylmethanofuran dehydrogenase subunit D
MIMKRQLQQLCLQGKGGKITVQSDSGEVMVDVVEQRKQENKSSFAFYIPGNSN